MGGVKLFCDKGRGDVKKKVGISQTLGTHALEGEIGSREGPELEETFREVREQKADLAKPTCGNDTKRKEICISR